MLKNKEQYVMVKERQSNDVVTFTFTKKERHCDTCGSLKKSRDITVVKYPIIDKFLGRVMMTKKVCMILPGMAMAIVKSGRVGKMK